MPQETQQNAAVRETFTIIDAVNPVLLDAGGTYPTVAIPFVFPLNYADQFVSLPVRTEGYNEIFGYVASDQTMSMAIYGFNDYNPITNQVLNRFHYSKSINSWVDPLLAGQNVIQISDKVSSPYIFFAIDNTGANPMTYFSIFMALRNV